MMANNVAYPAKAKNKFVSIDSSEAPTAFIRFLEERISFALVRGPATKENNIQTVYGNQRTAFFRCVSRGPAVEWFDS